MIKDVVKYVDLDDKEVTKEVRFKGTKRTVLQVFPEWANAEDGEAMKEYFTAHKAEMYAKIIDLVAVLYGERQGDLFIQNEDTLAQANYGGWLEVYVDNLLESGEDAVVAWLRKAVPTLNDK